MTRRVEIGGLPLPLQHAIARLAAGEQIVLTHDDQDVASITPLFPIADVDPASATATEAGTEAEPARDADWLDDAANGTDTGLESDEPAEPSRPSEQVTVVAAAMKLSAQARAILSEQLGPGHLVVDIRQAPTSTEVLLVPVLSGNALAGLRGQFPNARIIVTEIDDTEADVDYRGPVRRMLDAGADAYLPSGSLRNLATDIDRTLKHQALDPGRGAVTRRELGSGRERMDP